MLESNQNMISWLNKELSEAKRDRLRPPILPGGAIAGKPQAGYTFKPSNIDN